MGEGRKGEKKTRKEEGKCKGRRTKDDEDMGARGEGRGEGRKGNRQMKEGRGEGAIK